MFQTKETAIYADSGKHISVFLPDSSEVVLNAESEIVFNKKTWNENRLVSLSGEAFFKVKKGSRFTVKTTKGNIEVLGTSFNIFARNEKLTVKCFTGRVKVYNTFQNQIITPGEGVKIENGNQIEKYAFNNQQTADWTKGEFYFESADLKTVFDEIERQYNVKINLPDISGRKYTGFFTDKNLDQALQNVCIPMKLSFSVNKNKIEIKK
jgi:ferric-dicitrate binding protein FerR (iron transport regulator)